MLNQAMKALWLLTELNLVANQLNYADGGTFEERDARRRHLSNEIQQIKIELTSILADLSTDQVCNIHRRLELMATHRQASEFLSRYLTTLR